MKIYTRIELSIATGEVLHEESFEYSGPVALAGGGGDAPAPSAEERALQSEQAEMLRMQRARLEQQGAVQDLLAPYFYEQLGLSPQYGDDGEITGFDEIPDTEAELLRDQIELGLLERSQAALEGKLPVSPTLEREISEQGETLSARLRRNLGPGFETSSPAIEALQEHESRAIEAREAARRGELTLSEQLSLARGGQNFQMGQATRGELSAIPTMQPNFSNVIAGFNAPLNRMADERWRQFQIESQQPSFGSTLGQVFGIGIGAATGGVGTAIGTAIGQRMMQN